MHVEISGLVVGHPVHGCGLSLSIGPNRLRCFSLWKRSARAIERKTEGYLSVLYRTVILIEHLDYEGGHHPALQIIHFSLAGKCNHFKALRNGRGGRGSARLGRGSRKLPRLHRRSTGLGWLSRRAWGRSSALRLLLGQNGREREENYHYPRQPSADR